VGYKGKIIFDSSKPDGSPRKWMDSGKLATLGWMARIELSDGLKNAYFDYQKNHCKK
jgi:GDP-L-fucose synthase